MAVTAAQAQIRLPGVKMSPPPTLDGKLSEGEWASAAYSKAFIDPTTNAPAKDATEAWIAYDADHLYVAVRCHDAEPSKIVGREKQRGAEFDGEDEITVAVDPFLQRDWNGFSRFRCNPLGTQNEQISGGRSTKREWRGDWHVATSVDDGGWTAEFQIPWRILNLPPKGKRDIGFLIERDQYHTNIEHQLPNLGLDGRYERCGVLEGVELPASVRPLDLQGYISPEWRDDKFDVQVGLDVRYRITPQLTAVGTINPDFVNIEQQVAGIEFTRTERMLEDSRPFFTEGGDYFWLTSSYSFAQMFYSRRIGEFDYGAKVYGKLDQNNDVSALIARKGSSDTDSVVHAVHRFSPISSANVYGTFRERPGYTNTAMGGGGRYGTGLWGFSANGAQVDDDGSSADAGSLEVEYSAPRIFSVMRYIWIDPGFNPGLGYVGIQDRRGFSSYSEHSRDLKNGPFKFQGGDLFVTAYDHYDGSVQERSANLTAYAGTRKDLLIVLGGNATRFEDEYEHSVFGRLTFNHNDRTRQLSAMASTGHRDGEPTAFYSLGASYRIGRIDLGLNYALQEYQGTVDQVIFTVGSELDDRRSVTARVVQQDGHTNAYAAYRNAGFAGTEWYVIVGDPNALEWTDRIAAKIVWAW